jgi:predicted DNA-binding transcriptional regulator AlpA
LGISSKNEVSDVNATIEIQTVPAPVLYALPDILARGKFSKSHLYKLIQRGQFPAPVLVLGPRFTRWGSDVDQWFKSPAMWLAANAKAAA